MVNWNSRDVQASVRSIGAACAVFLHRAGFGVLSTLLWATLCFWPIVVEPPRNHGLERTAIVIFNVYIDTAVLYLMLVQLPFDVRLLPGTLKCLGCMALSSNAIRAWQKIPPTK